MYVQHQKPTAAVRTSRIPSVLIVVMVLSAFSPYLGVSLNIRYEHLVFYPVMLLVLLGILAGRRLGATRDLVALLACWLTLGALVTLNTAASAAGGLPALDPLSVVDSFLLPVAIFLVCFTVGRSPTQSVGHLLRVAAWTVVTALCLNSILILVFDPDNIGDFLRTFWSNSAVEGTTVAEQALLGDRYGGIFNQPFDGGVGYAVGVVAWIYLFLGARPTRPWTWVVGLLALALIISGGVSTQSKVFVYGALLVVAVTVVIGGARSIGRLGLRLRQISVAFLAILLASWLGFVDSFDRTLEFITSVREDPNKEYSGLRGITGGRQDSAGGWFEDFFESLSLTGRGLSGAQDDAYLSYLRGGGVFGLLLFVGVVIALFTIVRRQPKGSAERTLGFSLVLLMVFASTGALALQTNRGSTLFWVFIGLLAAKSAIPQPQATDEVAT